MNYGLLRLLRLNKQPLTLPNPIIPDHHNRWSFIVNIQTISNDSLFSSLIEETSRLEQMHFFFFFSVFVAYPSQHFDFSYRVFFGMCGYLIMANVVAFSISGKVGLVAS